jgi:hypothetical protein
MRDTYGSEIRLNLNAMCLRGPVVATSLTR